MAYYNGSVNSYDELLTALVNACTANGWTLASGILSKGAAYVKPSVKTTAPAGLLIEGGTGQSGATLINPSLTASRLGVLGSAAVWPAITWPSQYHIHIGVNPDEVYVVLNTNVSDFYWLAFGTSTVPMSGTGLWLAGSSSRDQLSVGIGVHIGPYFGSNNGSYACPAIFWATTDTITSRNDDVQVGAAGAWRASLTSGGSNTLAPLVARYELNWNKSAPLLPVRKYENVAANMRRLLIDAAHARIVRLGSLEPGQILQFGADKWRVYPFLRKNTAQADGGAGIFHTGTFGWALRYDGP